MTVQHEPAGKSAAAASGGRGWQELADAVARSAYSATNMILLWPLKSISVRSPQKTIEGEEDAQGRELSVDLATPGGEPRPIEIPDALWERLEVGVSSVGSSVTELLIEGIEMVLRKYEGLRAVSEWEEEHGEITEEELKEAGRQMYGSDQVAEES